MSPGRISRGRLALESSSMSAGSCGDCPSNWGVFKACGSLRVGEISASVFSYASRWKSLIASLCRVGQPRLRRSVLILRRMAIAIHPRREGSAKCLRSPMVLVGRLGCAHHCFDQFREALLTCIQSFQNEQEDPDCISVDTWSEFCRPVI